MRRSVPWALIIGAWATYGLFSAAQSIISSSLRGAPLTWYIALLLQMPQYMIWAMFTPVIIWLGRRFPLKRGHLLESIPIHVIVSLGFIFVLDMIYILHWSNVLPPDTPSTRSFLERATALFVVWALSDGLLYWMVLIISAMADHQKRLRERDLSAAHLETQLVQADLQALKMQLHPHFLFNALNTIGSLVRTGERDNAVKMVAGLGDLLRRVLDGASQQEVPLRQELEFVKSYLQIEELRFRDRLKVAISVDDAALDARVPHLILQPLVENAIRHGIGPHVSAGRLQIAARRVGDRLHLLVRDDGPGITQHPAGNGSRAGIGLSNTRARLERLYGDDYVLEVCNAVDGGLECRVELPFQPAAAEWQGTR